MPATNLEVFPPIPVETANAALLVIRNGNFYLSIGRLADTLFSKIDLADQATRLEISQQKLCLLYLVTIFQFTEMLSDSQAVEALQNRVDWKYALHLPLNCRGLQETDLCDFRSWLLVNRSGTNTLQTLLRRLSEITQAVKKPRLSGPNTEVVSQICLQNRLAIVWEVLREVLQILAAEQPAWLGTIYQPRWYQRYGKSPQAFDFIFAKSEQVDLAQTIGNDGYYLLKAISASNSTDIQELPELSVLKQVWQEQFELMDDQAIWRTIGCAKCSMLAELHKTDISDLQAAKGGEQNPTHP